MNRWVGRMVNEYSSGWIECITLCHGLLSNFVGFMDILSTAF